MILSRLLGTFQSLFKINNVKLKSTGVDGELEIRNNADSAYGSIKAANLELTNPLPIASGGTGLGTIGSDGEVLQVSGGSLVYASLSADIDITDNIENITTANTLTLINGKVENLGSGNAKINFHGYASTADYDPIAVGDCYLWFKSDTGITKDSLNQVSEWADQSGSARNATQATVASQPAYIPHTNNMNGYPQIYFDGIEDFLLTTATPVSGAGVRTMVIVGGWGSTIPVSANTRIMAGWGGGSTNTEYGIAVRVRPNNSGSATKPSFGMYYYNNDYAASTPSAEIAPFIVCSSYDGTTDRMWYNNVLSYERAVVLNTNSTNKFRMGRGVFGTATSANYMAAEIIVFTKVLDSTERAAMFTTLSAKYGIEIVP